jgi:hypothetical protein
LPPPKDVTPPASVKNLTAKPGDRKATLKWAPPGDADFKEVEIDRTTETTLQSSGAAATIVYHGSATSYVDKGLTNGVEYRYIVRSVDKNGNKSGGVVITVTPFRPLLQTPADGARLAAVPKKFVWARDAKASYYNFQLYAGGQLLAQSTSTSLAAPKKILSAWTDAPSLAFKSPWKWEGKSYKMVKGIYTWYVWPGYGERAAVKYGPLMGSAAFQLTKNPAAPKKPKKPKK